MTKRLLHHAGIGLCAVALAVIMAGCGSDWQNYTEKFVRAGICRPSEKDVPEWVQGELPVSDEEVYFVGRGVGNHALDERGAYDAAVEHVVEQVAMQIATTVKASAEKHRRREVTSAQSMATQALVGGIAPRDVYWEQWYIEEMSGGLCDKPKSMQRYKCWVLMAISKKAMAKHASETLALLKAQAAAPNSLFVTVGTHSGLDMD